MTVHSKSNGQDIAASSDKIDVRMLHQELKRKLQGEVRFDEGSRALYSTDASNYRQIPIGVVIPKNEKDIIDTVSLCKKYKAPILSRGGGTSLAGQCCNVAVVMDMSKYFNKILDFNIGERTVTVQPGISLDQVRNYVEEYDLTFGPDPATHDHCTIGGMLGNNSCGVHSVMAEMEGTGARMSDNITEMTVLTYDGTRMIVGETSKRKLDAIRREGGRQKDIYNQLVDLRSKYEKQIRVKFPNIPRRVSGYNLPDLLSDSNFHVAKALVGSEGTCVVILNATLKLLPKPKSKSLLVLGYSDVFEAGRHVMQILKHKPIGLEGIDDKLIRYMEKKHLHEQDIPLLPKGKGWLLVEFGGKNKMDADRKANAVIQELKKEKEVPAIKLFDDPEEEAKLWEIRESGLGATAWVPGEPDSFPGWEDSAVSPSRIGEYLRDLRNLFNRYGYNPALYGHFGQGCVHCRVGFDLYTQQGIAKYKEFTKDAAQLVAKYGGSISGEHGDGQSRGDLLELMYGKELVNAFREFKLIWDPTWKMNPGKVVDPYGRLENLRLGTDYEPAKVDTYFRYPDDHGSFAHASLRCVGVGKCRRYEGGTMCPSFMATHEEEHSTRGRAHLLFEMMQGDFIHGPWKNEQVKRALDLCLACKGCKSDCPVNVDMATYKAEFLSHYYHGKLRPRIAYFFGHIYSWARLAAPIAGLANFFTQTRLFSPLFKKAAGIDRHRSIPPFAKETFRSWCKANKPPDSDGKRIILWVDTFNNFFLPDTLKAALRVLTAAGFDVVIPGKNLCCGRPLYDYGMLRTAKRRLTQILEELQMDIRNGTPVVGIEPSCIAVFRDELTNLFPDDEDAKRLAQQTYTLAECLMQEAPDFHVPPIGGKVIVHGHCHHKAIMKMDADELLLKKLKVDYTLLNSGCCGMAGSFGYENGRNYDVSVKAGENVLLPKLRKTGSDTIILADGFSCRSQIEHLAKRSPWHLAEFLDHAIHKSKPDITV
ncbi:MAG TPA: FAD-linked oxidase C-terminal domain-containing protein [Cyclobacteriaceae bacterium]|nr:FAD-linked oxidase C-terminal domain-containing protein [Cyclobacteriaceae bacterium]